jgi:hypothetical protein
MAGRIGFPDATQPKPNHGFRAGPPLKNSQLRTHNSELNNLSLLPRIKTLGILTCFKTFLLNN